MRIRVMSWVFDHSEAVGNALLVFLALADRMDEEGLAWPSIRHLERKTRLSESTVRRALQELEELGELKTGQRIGRSSVYQTLKYRGYGLPVDNGSERGGCQFDTGVSRDTPGVSTVTPHRSITDTSIPKPNNAREEETTKKKRRTSLPLGVPSEEDKAWWRDHWKKWDIAELDPETEAEKFRDHHSQKGSVFSDWRAASRQWGRRAGEYALERNSRLAGFHGAAKGGSRIPHRSWLDERTEEAIRRVKAREAE